MTEPSSPFMLADDSVLAVRDLSVSFTQQGQVTQAVRQLSLEVRRGETLALVGESGSGKSVTSLALMRLIEQSGGRLESGELWLRRRDNSVVDLARLRQSQMRAIRGADMAMIFQEPMTSLNPVFPVGEQIAESVRLHQGKSHQQALAEARRMLDLVRIPEAQNVMTRFPHQLSGGMRQRVMIAMALLCRPKLLIADEPTTALDVTVQAQIMTLLNDLKREFNTAIIMITHDLGVVAGICDKVLVMYAGRTMEYGKARDVFYHPAHPYSLGLLSAVPRLDTDGETLMTIPGNPPNLLRLPGGCPFQPRCPYAMEICANAPPLEAFGEGRLRACFKPVEELV